MHLVLATTFNQSISLGWTANLTIPNLKFIPYIADNLDAAFHPEVNKGNEAMMYLTYLHDFYDKLPDITIFTHGQDYAWHVDGILEQSTLYALNNLDLAHVMRRQYVNLRISWDNACPDWMNTTISQFSEEYDPELKAEEPFMKYSFETIFPNETIPEILSQPCCSQFAVTREAIRSVPRAHYNASIAWLKDTYLPDTLSGRIWEHLWQYLFLRKEVDCPDDRIALCATYRICFEEEQDWIDWKYYERLVQGFEENRITYLEGGITPENRLLGHVEHMIVEYHEKMTPLKRRALELGRDEEARRSVVGEG